MLAPQAQAALLDIQSMEQPLAIPEGFGLRLGYMATDNVERVPVDEQDARIAVLQLISNWDYDGARMDAIVTGDISYRHYSEDAYDNEYRGNLFAGASYEILQDNLSWQLTNHFANTAISPLATAAPDNTQYFNVTETGPSVLLHPGDRHEVDLSLLRARAQAEVSPVDHDRNSLLAGWTYNMSPLTDLSLSGGSRQMDFDAELDAEDYDQHELMAGLATRRQNLNIFLEAGRSRVEMDDGESHETEVGRLRIGARRTMTSRVFLYASRRLGDTAGLINRDLLEPGNIWSITAASDPYVAKSAGITYTRGTSGRQWSAIISGNDVDYFVSEFDQEQRGGRLEGQLMLTSDLMMELSAARVKIDYLAQARTDRLSEARAEFDYRIDRRWSIIAGLRRVHGNSSDPEFDFDENFVTLFVNFVPGGRSLGGSAR